MEAHQDPSTGLTYTALTGIRKQSVQDVERLFSHGIINFMERHMYENEATYLKITRNWRRAVDERCLSDEQRKQFCDEFLIFIMSDLIPWQSTNQVDLTQLEVNRFAFFSLSIKIIILYSNHSISDQLMM